MRIPKSINECVVFLGHADAKNPDNVITRATGFLVGYARLPHLVTAKHNISNLGDHFVVRVNARAPANYGRIAISRPRWFFHPNDEFVDVAVMLWGDHPELERKFVFPEQIASDKIIQERGVGLGDDIISGGFYYATAGQKRITPLVRCGTIAMMPTEKIPIKLLDQTGIQISGEAEAFLVEAKVIGGFSGAPVFVRQYFPDRVKTQWHQWFYLLGLVHGHWEINNIPEPYLTQMNEGIVHVVPGQKILEVLEHPDLVASRKQMQARIDGTTT
jgi:hypothetical protein